jgi:hypothetical protein
VLHLEAYAMQPAPLGRLQSGKSGSRLGGWSADRCLAVRDIGRWRRVRLFLGAGDGGRGALAGMTLGSGGAAGENGQQCHPEGQWARHGDTSGSRDRG